MRALAVVLAAGVLCGLVPAALRATPPTVGGKCAKAGQGIQSLHLICVKKGGKLVWAPFTGGGTSGNGGQNGKGGQSGSGGNNSGNSGGSNGYGSSSADASPMLETFQLRVGTYDPATGKAGDLLVSKSGLQPQVGTNSVFLEFGHPVSGQQTKGLPHFTFYAPLGTQVVSPLSGVVIQVQAKPSGLDDSITVVPNMASNWGVNLDHITGRTVQQGQSVSAGQVIGTVGIPEGGAAGWGANELTLFHFTGSPRDDAHKTFVCPWEGWDPAKLSAAQATITRLMSDWETWYGDSTVYDQAHQVSPGCDFESEPAQ